MIKIKNIYYMLAYAFEALNTEGYKYLESEEFENAADLFAAILAKGISAQVKRGLAREYLEITEPLSKVNGKIEVTASILQKATLGRQLICSHDEFTQNAYLNKVLKSTSMLLIKSSDVSKEYKEQLKKAMLYFKDVDTVDPRMIKWSTIKYSRNNASYEMLVNLCYLVVSGMLMTESDGTLRLNRFVDDQNMHRLYEKFVLGYFKKHYSYLHPEPKQVKWAVEGSDDFLPVMQTDVTLRYGNKTMIIDTKYYSRSMQLNSKYNKLSIHSSNLYQIFSYVQNERFVNGGDVCGILLYAKTDEDITPDFDYVICGSPISVKTLDLSGDFSTIKEQLDTIAQIVLAKQ
mgnify:CR=1 FL=1